MKANSQMMKRTATVDATTPTALGARRYMSVVVRGVVRRWSTKLVEVVLVDWLCDAEWCNCSYVGQWARGEKHGQGSWVNSRTGEQYEGSWLQGSWDGHGIWHEQGGDSYEGQWSLGFKNGLGSLKLQTGACISGCSLSVFGSHAVSDTLCARTVHHTTALCITLVHICLLSDSAGELYEGEWNVDQRHGNGKWTDCEGDQRCAVWYSVSLIV